MSDEELFSEDTCIETVQSKNLSILISYDMIYIYIYIYIYYCHKYKYDSNDIYGSNILKCIFYLIEFILKNGVNSSNISLEETGGGGLNEDGEDEGDHTDEKDKKKKCIVM